MDYFMYVSTQKYYELEQYNNSPTLNTKSCNGNGGGVGLSFYWDVFSNEGMVGEKIINTSFGEAAGYGKWVPGACATRARIADASATRSLRGVD